MAGTEISEISSAKENSEINLTPVFSYLATDKGHEIATKALGIFEGFKRIGLQNSATHTALELGAKLGGFATIVGAAVYLSTIGKFDSSVGVLFGTLIGYLFGKKQ